MLSGGGVGLWVRESTVATFTKRSLHFCELGVGVPLIFYNFVKSYPIKSNRAGPPPLILEGLGATLILLVLFKLG